MDQFKQSFNKQREQLSVSVLRCEVMETAFPLSIDNLPTCSLTLPAMCKQKEAFVLLSSAVTHPLHTPPEHTSFSVPQDWLLCCILTHSLHCPSLILTDLLIRSDFNSSFIASYALRSKAQEFPLHVSPPLSLPLHVNPASFDHLS